jgi:hypothetical protein
MNARSCLSIKSYDFLESYAAKYRASKEHFADGEWKLDSFYGGLDLPETAPDSMFVARITALTNWITAKPNSITPRVALANVLVSYAWKARGNDWANTVSKENALIFKDRLHQAAAVLSDARNLKEQCPGYWSALLNADLGLEVSRAEFETNFNDAINFAPDYTALYSARAIFLLPRWFGTEGELEKDLAAQADKVGGEKGDMLYAQVVWGLHRSLSFLGQIFNEHYFSWVRIDKGFDAIEKQFPDSLAAKNERAFLAELADDKMAARKYFEQTQGKADLSVFGSRENYISVAKAAYKY